MSELEKYLAKTQELMTIRGKVKDRQPIKI
jgi:hypothetical protein